MHVCMCTCVCSHVHVHASEHVHHVSLYACVGVCVCGIHVCECLIIIMFTGYACVMMLVLYVVLVFQVFVSAMGRRRAKSGCMLISSALNC